MDLNQGIKYALDGRALLFTGAGFSKGAKSVRGEMKTSRELAEHLVTLTGLSLADGIESLSQEFVEKNGIDALIKELKGEFTAAEVGDQHRAIARIPWRRVYSTNYDDVFEKAAAQIGEAVTSVTLSQQPHHVPKTANDPLLVVHLNGFVNAVNRENVLHEVKLTDTSYLQPILDSQWISLLIQDLSALQAVFFVGYSMSDVDIKRLFSPNLALRDKTFFIVGENPDGALVRKINQFGLLVDIGTVDLARKFEEISKAYTPDAGPPLPYCLYKFEPTPATAHFEDRFFFELVALGDVHEDFLWDGLHGGAPYVVSRDIAQEALHVISCENKIVVIHSGLANGKSLVLDILAASAFEAGYAAFFANHHGDSLVDEVEYALTQPGPILFVVDDYSRWHDLLEVLAHRIAPNVRIVVAARNAAHDVEIDYLLRTFPGRDIVELSADRLSYDDMDRFVQLLNRYGAWGERSLLSDERKRSFIANDCSGQIHALLLRLFESPDIRERLEDLFAEVSDSRVYHKPIIAILILAVLGYPLDFNELGVLTGNQIFEIGFKKNPAVEQLIDFDQGRVRLRSSALAEFILRRIANPNVVLDVLIGLVRTADRTVGRSPLLGGVVKALTRLRTLESVLSGGNSGQMTMRFYESVKDLDLCRRNPQFWLQYAIAALAVRNFERARKYFENAYAFARSIRGYEYDTYKIDNHFARLLLIEATSEGKKAKSLDAFRSARKILNAEMVRTERIQYGYRIAIEMANMYDRFSNELSAGERNEFHDIADAVIARIQALPEHRRDQRYIQEALRDMRNLLAATA